MPAARILLALALACLPLAARALTLRYASQDDPQTLDPHAANLLSSSRVTANVYETLVWRDKAWKLVPWLATRGRSPTKDLALSLRAWVPTTSRGDVVFSGRALSPPRRCGALQGVEKAQGWTRSRWTS
jgi:peptide/nickel transport system substrate-binding protein